MVKLLTLIERFRSELLLILISLSIIVIAVTFFLQSSQKNEEIVQFQSEQATPAASVEKTFPTILVDIAGAVEKPDVYEVSAGARLKDALILAGGLSLRADREFFERTFNQAKKLTDQEKIYIPSQEEVSGGDVAGAYTNPTETPVNGKMNINTVPSESLDRLPGVGPVTASKIISARPYKQIEDLLNKKVVSNAVYEKIKGLITVE